MTNNQTTTPPTTLAGQDPTAWHDGNVVRLRGADTGPELAGRLLADESVRAVIVDRDRGEAMIHLAKGREESSESLLNEIASLASSQQTALAKTTQRLSASNEIVCWLDQERGLDSYFRAPQMASGIKRALYLLGAAVTFGLAVLGVILPGVPTTPFLLLTSYCLIRSSRKLHDRLLKSRIFGGLLRDWHTHRGVRPGVKTKSLAVMALVVGATVVFSGLPLRAMFGIVSCSMIGVVCILRLRVIR